MPYESGFEWRCEESSEPKRPGVNPWTWNLYAPNGKVAATVFCDDQYGLGHNWFAWDRNGTSGENSREQTIENAKIAAEAAVLRFGKHFAAIRVRKSRRKEVAVAGTSE